MGDSNKTEKSAKPSFFKGVQSEFKKISWPDKTQRVKQSVAVICVAVVLGVVIALLDILFQYGINFLTM